MNYKVAKNFTDTVKEKALGQNVLTAVKPSQLMVKIVHDELTKQLFVTRFQYDKRVLISFRFSFNLDFRRKLHKDIISVTQSEINAITNLNYTSEKEKSQVTFFADLDAIAGMLKMIKDCLSVIGDSALEGTTSTEEIGNALYITEITLDTTIADCVHLVEKIRP